jgi:hypothetical protein
MLPTILLILVCFAIAFWGLRKTSKKKLSPKKDPWEGGHQSYVSHFRKELEAFAQEFSSGTLLVRYNQKEKCAEVHFPHGMILMQVHVRGEMGIPYEATIVCIAFNGMIKDAIQSMFGKKIEVTWEILFDPTITTVVGG